MINVDTKFTREFGKHISDQLFGKHISDQLPCSLKFTTMEIYKENLKQESQQGYNFI